MPGFGPPTISLFVGVSPTGSTLPPYRGVPSVRRPQPFGGASWVLLCVVSCHHYPFSLASSTVSSQVFVSHPTPWSGSAVTLGAPRHALYCYLLRSLLGPSRCALWRRWCCISCGGPPSGRPFYYLAMLTVLSLVFLLVSLRSFTVSLTSVVHLMSTRGLHRVCILSASSI